MNLAWIAALSLVVATEKMLPGGERIATALGIVLIALGSVIRDFLNPDFTLMTELQEFQAEPSGPGQAGVIIRIGMMMTLIREEDRRIVATRAFMASAAVPSDDTLTVVAGFDTALQSVLRQAVAWTVAQAG